MVTMVIITMVIMVINNNVVPRLMVSAALWWTLLDKVACGRAAHAVQHHSMNCEVATSPSIQVEMWDIWPADAGALVKKYHGTNIIEHSNFVVSIIMVSITVVTMVSISTVITVKMFYHVRGYKLRCGGSCWTKWHADEPHSIFNGARWTV
jgi:hypothetical protein